VKRDDHVEDAWWKIYADQISPLSVWYEWLLQPVAQDSPKSISHVFKHFGLIKANPWKTINSWRNAWIDFYAAGSFFKLMTEKDEEALEMLEKVTPPDVRVQNLFPVLVDGMKSIEEINGMLLSTYWDYKLQQNPNLTDE